jgi:AraC-like DNA-binding protein
LPSRIFKTGEPMNHSVQYVDLKEPFIIERRKKIGYFSMQSNHFHRYYELYYLVSGKRYYFLSNRTYLLNRGDLIFIPQHEIHQTLDADSPEHERILIYFRRDFLPAGWSDCEALIQKLFSATSANPVIRFTIPQQNQVENLLHKMLHESQTESGSQLLFLQTLLVQLLILSGRQLDSGCKEPFEHPSSMHEKVSEIVQYINDHFAEPLNLATVAGEFYISPFYLCRIFKEATGFTFNEYLSGVRLKEAQKLLRETRLKIIRIVERAGFGSIAQFGRVFKKATGISPLNYRKINRYPQ